MKSKILKIWGLVMVVAILAGLLVPAAVPVSAANLSYTNVPLPNGNNDQFTPGTSVNVFSMAADGKTMFAYSNTGTNSASVTYTKALYKSTDGGITWTTTGLGTTLNTNTIIALKVSPNYATDQTLVAASATAVYFSTNGGTSFGTLPLTGAPAGTITSVDVAQYYLGGLAYLIGFSTGAGTGGVALFQTTNFQLINLTTGIFAAAWGSLGTQDVVAVAFSPKHMSDGAIMVVSSTAGSGTYLRTLLAPSAATPVWDANVGNGRLKFNGTTDTNAQANLVASLAFPSDFDLYGNNRTFIGLGLSTGLLATGSVYRVTGQAGGNTSTVFDMAPQGAGAATNISDIAFSGYMATGTLAVGLVSNAASATPTTVYSATGTAGTPIWVSSNFYSQPLNSAGLTQVAFSPVAAAGKPYTLYVGTQNTHGALYTSTDYFSYAALSLISVSNNAGVVSNLVPGLPSSAGSNMYMLMRDQAGSLVSGGTMTTGDLTMLLKSTDAGITWTAIFNRITQLSRTPGVPGASPAAGEYMNGISVSPTFATDNILYVKQNDYQIWKSTDAGNTFLPYQSPNSVTIAAMTLIDANNYYIGAANTGGGPNIGGIYKSGSFTQAATLDGNAVSGMTLGATSPTIGDPNVIYVTTTTGEVYYSADGGVTYTTLGGQGAINGHTSPVSLAFDPGYKTNKTIYAASGGGAGNIIYRWVVGTSTTWETMATIGGPGWTAPNALTPPVNQTTPKFNALSVTSDGTMYVIVADTASPKTAAPVIYRNNNPLLPATQQVFSAISNAQVPGFPSALLSAPLTITLGVNNVYASLGPPVLILPAGTVGPPPTTANKFSFIAYDGNIGAGVNGYPYQWLQMTDTLVAGPSITSPAANAQVPTGTSISWAAVPGATGYNVLVATDPQFNGLVATANNISGLNQTPTAIAGGTDTFTSATSINLPTGTLNPGTTYYTKVQATRPLTSKFSAPVTFAALLSQLGTQINIPGQYGPIAGSINIPLKPVFQWAGVQGAQSYDLQVADNPVFVNPLDAQTGLNTTVWTETKTLSPNSVYYWRVRAVAANGTGSEWVAGSFTTVGPVSTAPAGTAAPTAAVTITQTQAPVTITQTPAAKFFDQNSGLYFNTQNELSAYQLAHPGTPSTTPSTPSYIWVIIVIGAILVIAVIVLIVRTRKV